MHLRVELSGLAEELDVRCERRKRVSMIRRCLQLVMDLQLSGKDLGRSRGLLFVFVSGGGCWQRKHVLN